MTSKCKTVYVQLSTAAPDDWSVGGPVRIIDDYAKTISTLEDTILLVSSRTSKKPRFTDKPYKIRIFPAIRIFNNFGYNIPSLSLISKLISIINDNEKIVIHLSTFRSSLSILVILLSKYYSKRIYVAWSVFGQLHYKRSSLRFIYDLLFKKMFFDSISVSLCQNLAEYQLMHHHLRTRERLALIPLSSLDAEAFLKKNQVDSHSYLASKIWARQQIKRYLPTAIDSEQPVIINISRFFWAKGHIRLLQSFSRALQDDGFRAKRPMLILIGCDQGYLSNIKEMICDLNLDNYVVILENISDDRFLFCLAADMFAAFPLIDEQSMLASIEALSCGCKIVVSKEASLKVSESMIANNQIVELEYCLESSANALKSHFLYPDDFHPQSCMNLYNQNFRSDIIAKSLYTAIFNE